MADARGATGTAGRTVRFLADFRADLAVREDLRETFLDRAAFLAIFRLGAAFFRPARAGFFLRFAIAIPPGEGQRVYLLTQK